MLPCVCSVIDHRGRQNVVRTSVTHSAAPRQHGIYLLNRDYFQKFEWSGTKVFEQFNNFASAK